MALSGSTVWEVRTAGSDTNGGGFVTGAAGADFSQQNSANATNQGTTTLSAAITSTSATSSTVTAASALYGAAQALLANPLVGDWIQIDSEVMKVTAVSTNTLTITRGQLGTTAATHLINATVTNISNVSTTDWVTASSTTITSATAFFSANLVGNIVYVAGGTGSITGGWYQVTAAGTSVALTTITVDRSTGLSVGTGATGNIGGALGSPGQAAANAVSSNTIWIKTGTYSITSASTNVSGGCMSFGNGVPVLIEGYSATRGDLASPPTLQASGISTATIVATGTGTNIVNLIVDGQSLTSIRGFVLGTGSWYLLTAKNCTNSGFAGGNGSLVACIATGCSSQPAFTNGAGSPHPTFFMCEAYGNTITGFDVGEGTCVFCLSYGNTGASSYGFQVPLNGAAFYNCVAYGNGSHGFHPNGAQGIIITNCIAEGNGGYGFNAGSADPGNLWINCAGYNNSSGNTNIPTAGTLPGALKFGFIAYSASAFVNAASGNFALNNNNPGGAQLRAAGIPGTFPDGLTTGYLDIGAAQHQDSPAQLFIIND